MNHLLTETQDHFCMNIKNQTPLTIGYARFEQHNLPLTAKYIPNNRKKTSF